jgi:hypothetical protein
MLADVRFHLPLLLISSRVFSCSGGTETELAYLGRRSVAVPPLRDSQGQGFASATLRLPACAVPLLQVSRACPYSWLRRVSEGVRPPGCAVSRQRSADAGSRPWVCKPVDLLVPCEPGPQEPPLISSQLRESLVAYGRLVSSKHEWIVVVPAREWSRKARHPRGGDIRIFLEKYC